jgi:hypothetical protein
MKHLIISVVLIVLFLGLFTKCYYDSKEYLYPELGSQCDTTNVTFSVSVKNVLTNNYCMDCHSNANSAAGGDIKLESYADVKTMADNGHLLGAILHQTGFSFMPKNGGSLSDCDITVIKKWIASQTPNN